MNILIVLLAIYVVFKLIYSYNKYKVMKKFLDSYNIMINNKTLGGINISKEGIDIKISFYDTEGNLISYE